MVFFLFFFLKKVIIHTAKQSVTFLQLSRKARNLRACILACEACEPREGRENLSIFHLLVPDLSFDDYAPSRPMQKSDCFAV